MWTSHLYTFGILKTAIKLRYNLTKYIKRGFMKPIPKMTEGKVSEKLTMKVESNYNTGRKHL